MATKKQKRLLALAKHEAFMAEIRRTGLRAQKAGKAQLTESLSEEQQETLKNTTTSNIEENI